MPAIPPYPNNGGDSGLPGWAKIVGIIALIVILLVVILMLTGGLGGPGGHTPPQGAH